MQENWREALRLAMPEASIAWDEDMSRHTSMRVGGAADALLQANHQDEIVSALRFVRSQDVPVLVMGQGSNLIVRDGGIRGLVIAIGEGMKRCEIKGKTARVQAGCRLPFLAREAMQKNLGGLEYVSGIPGTVGGAIVMNAGAYGGDVSQRLASVVYIDENLRILKISPQEGDMGYRSSIFSRNHWIVLEAEFSLTYDTNGEARKRFDDFKNRRMQKQPLDQPSAGSIFKRPEGHFAGQLIQEAGLTGFAVGGAQVSPVHAGFIVNTGSAKAADVIELIEIVQNRVWEHAAVRLETEVKIVGESCN